MYVVLVIQIDHLNTKVIIDTVCSDRLSLHISDHVYGRVYSDRPSFHRNDHVCGLVYPLSLHRLIMCMGVSASFHRSDHVYVGVYIQTGHLFIEVILCLDASSDRPSISPQNWLCMFVCLLRSASFHRSDHVCGRVCSDRPSPQNLCVWACIFKSAISLQNDNVCGRVCSPSFHRSDHVCGRVYSDRPFFHRSDHGSNLIYSNRTSAIEVIMFEFIHIGYSPQRWIYMWPCPFKRTIFP